MPTHDVPPLPATLDDKTWSQRFTALHQQLYASEVQEFDDVMSLMYQQPDGYILADSCLVHHDGKWHLFYVTGPFTNAKPFMEGLQSGDFKRCVAYTYEEGDAHAVGTSLWNLRYHDTILKVRQANLGMMGQGTSSIHWFNDHWISIYTTRDPHGLALCLAHSPDLYTWEYEPTNPIWTPPDYAKATGRCKNAHVMRHPTTGRYLVYYCLTLKTGASAVGLFSTEDFKSYADHGVVMAMPHQLRGTQGVESPCVVYRAGMWHLFFGTGQGVWHAMSNRPDGFMGGGQELRQGSVEGTYFFGRFHAVENVEHAGRWYMTSTRKDQSRYERRRSGIHAFRGLLYDEALWLDGLYLSELIWDGDQPTLRKISRGNDE